MDIGRAFSFFSKDSEWLKKILIGGLVSLIPIVGTWMVYGYALEVAKDAYNADDETMPEWNDLGGYLVRGLLLQLGVLIWLLPLLIIFGVGFLIAALIGNASEVAGAILIFSEVGVFVLVLIFWLVAILPIIGGRYAVQRRFGAMLEISNVFKEIRRAGVSVLIFLLIALIAEFVGGLGLIACFIGVVFTSFYAEIVIGHGVGQLYRQATGHEPLAAVEPQPPIAF